METKYLFFIRKAFENCVWVTRPSARSLFVLLANFRCSLLFSWWLRIPVTNFFIFPSKFFWINQYTLCLSAMAFYFPFLNILALNVFVFAFEKSLENTSRYLQALRVFSQHPTWFIAPINPLLWNNYMKNVWQREENFIVLCDSSCLFSTNSSDDSGKSVTETESIKAQMRGAQNPHSKATNWHLACSLNPFCFSWAGHVYQRFSLLRFSIHPTLTLS